MADTDIVQVIAEARIDARSLSEFVFKPAGFKVARRLAPTIDTLQFYINRFNSLNGDFSSSVSAAQSSLDNSVAEAQGKVAYIETTVQDAINQSILSSGFVTIDSFELGATIAQRNQALRHAADGKLYRWAGDLPKTIPASSTPTSSGGIGDNAWLEVGDVTLRQDLANPDKGAAMVAYSESNVHDALDALRKFQDFKDLPTLLGNTSLDYGGGGVNQVAAGDVLGTRSGAFSYQVAASGATDYHLTTAGGVKIYALPLAGGYSVGSFGAVGDGVTDDTAAIQKSLDVGGHVYLEGDKKYLVSGPLVFDCHKVVSFDGRNARIITTADDYIFDVRSTHSLHSGAVSPKTVLLAQNGGFNVIERVKFMCTETERTGLFGKAIRIWRTLGITVRDCSFLNIAFGVVFDGSNRNAEISNNYFFNIAEYGIHLLPEHNIHQLVVSNNSAFGFKKFLYNEQAEIVNLLLDGNHCECGSSAGQSQTESIVHISSSSFNLEGQIINNHFQDHGSVTDGLLVLDREGATPSTATVSLMTVSGNEFSNTPEGVPAVKGSNVAAIRFDGNTFYQTKGACFEISASGSCEITVKNNVGWKISDFALIEAQSVTFLNVSNNSVASDVTYKLDKFIHMRLSGSIVGSVRVCDNAYGTRYTSSPAGSALIDIQSVAAIRSLHIKGNSLAVTNSTNPVDGIRLSTTSGDARGIVKDNVVYRLGGTEYDLPPASDTLTIADNIVT